MIENKLSSLELTLILRPILQLSPVQKILSELEEVFPVKLTTLNDVIEYTRQYNVTYQGFGIFIRGLDELSENSIYTTIQFKIDKHWLHIFKNPAAKIISDLKKICLLEIAGLSIKPYQTRAYSYPHHSDNLESFTYYYDSNALNTKWKEGTELSSLIISPSENEKYYFVEFHFNSNCYLRLNNKTILKDDWKDHVTDVTTFIDRKANELLKYGFKK